MLLKRLSANNYFIAMLVLLGITILLVVSVFILTAYIPEALGREPYNYEINCAFEFEPWAFEADGLEVSFPEGGVIVNTNLTDRIRSDLLLGEGTFRRDGHPPAAEHTGGLFLVTDHQLFEQIRGDNIFIPVEDELFLAQLAAIVDKQIGIPVIWDDTFNMSFHKNAGLIYQYFVTPEGEPILPPRDNEPSVAIFGSFMVYTLYIVILLLVLTILSPDHHYSRYWIHLRETHPGIFSLAVIPVIAVLAAASELIPEFFSLPDYYAVLGYGAILALLILSARIGKIDYLDFGLRRDRLKNGYLLAIVAAMLIVGAARGLPGELSISGPGTFLLLPLFFLLLSLPHEMIWRGYIQAFLSRRLGFAKGLLATALLAALIHYVYLMISAPWMTGYAYTYLEVAVLVPGLAIILGYLYLRTENILACALLHSMILWLPGIII